MSTLITDSINGPKIQEFKTTETIKCEGFKLWLYNNNMPAGNFKLELVKDTRVIKEWNFTSLDMRNSFGGTEDYFHVYMSFLSKSFYLQGTYNLVITTTGYTETPTSFIGWNKDYDGVFGNHYPGNVEFTDYPYSFRILRRV